MKVSKWSLINVFLFGVLIQECIMIRNRLHFRPAVDRLEARAVLDGAVVSAPPEMPNGVDAFTPENSAVIFDSYYDLIVDVNGSLLIGSAPVDPNAPLNSADPNKFSDGTTPNDSDLDSAYQSLFQSSPPS